MKGLNTYTVAAKNTDAYSYCGQVLLYQVRYSFVFVRSNFCRYMEMLLNDTRLNNLVTKI